MDGVGEDQQHDQWLEADVALLLRELKRPLQRIAADASALLGTLGTSHAIGTQALHRIDHSIMILERSIEQLIEIHAIETGTLAMDLQTTELGALVDSVVCGYPEVDRIEHVATEPVTVMADPRRLGFGIASLLYAALASPPSTSRIAVRTSREGTRAQISVMAATRSTDHALGLHIARRIAQTHGGTATMTALVGMTRYCMDLPVARQLTRHPVTGPITVLLVDDNLEQVSALAELLRQDGLDIEYTTTGRDALAYIAKRMPDLLIVDVQIPDMSGAEVVRRAREQRPELPAVLLTGYPPDHPEIRAAMASTNSTYIPKPVNVDALLDVVTSVVRGD